MPDDLRLDTERSAFRFEELLRANPEPQDSSFGDMLTDQIEELSAIDSKPDETLSDLLSGKEKDLHTVMLRLSEADLSLRFALEVRNRLLEAFQELQRMPI